MLKYVFFYFLSVLTVGLLTSLFEVGKRLIEAVAFLYRMSLGKVIKRAAKLFSWLNKPLKALDYAMMWVSAVVAGIFIILGYFLIVVPFYDLAIKCVHLLWQGKRKEALARAKDAISGGTFFREIQEMSNRC